MKNVAEAVIKNNITFRQLRQKKIEKYSSDEGSSAKSYPH